MLIEIKSDPLFVTNRLKEIDQDYFLVFNTIKHKYEVHNHNQIGCTYCLTYPNPALDERLIELVKKTRRENIDELMKEIDKANKKIEQEFIKSQKEKMEEEWKQNKFWN